MESVAHTGLNHISGETHARTLWEHLKSLYARKIGNNNTFLIKEMLSLNYHDGSPMTDHLNNFQGIMNQLSAMGIKFDEEIQGLLLLGSLPDSWETFRTSLSNSSPDGVISMDSAKSIVLNEEMRRKTQGSSSSDVLINGPRGEIKLVVLSIENKIGANPMTYLRILSTIIVA